MRAAKAPKGSSTKRKKAKPRPGRRADALAAKRDHRRRLSARAAQHWQRTGDDERRGYLDRVRRALEAEGFRSTPLQWKHRGHAFGLVKDRGDRQIHVRVYEDGVIDAELEIHRRFLEHLLSPRPSAHRLVRGLLAKHGIPTHLLNERYIPRLAAARRRYPKTRTPVRRVLGGAAGLVGGVVALSVARFYLDRLRKRRSG